MCSEGRRNGGGEALKERREGGVGSFFGSGYFSAEELAFRLKGRLETTFSEGRYVPYGRAGEEIA